MPFLLRRAARLVVVLLVVTFLATALIELLPGDPTTQMLGFGATEEARAELRHDLGLDRALPARYVGWLGDAVTGDLGTSYHTHESVLDSLRQRLPVTLELLALAQLVALGVAVPVALLAATRAGGLVDRGLTVASFGLLATPVFVTGVVLIGLFAVRWDLLPASGFTAMSDGLGDNLRSLVLPTLSLASVQVAVYARLLRSDLITTLQEDYIALARARGLSARRILWRHALRPSTTSLVTVIGLNVGSMIGGSVIVETLFGLPGLGRLLADSVFSRDYMVVQGGVVVVAVGFVLVNLLVDVVYAALDPRIRRAG